MVAFGDGENVQQALKQVQDTTTLAPNAHRSGLRNLQGRTWEHNAFPSRKLCERKLRKLDPRNARTCTPHSMFEIANPEPWAGNPMEKSTRNLFRIPLLMFDHPLIPLSSVRDKPEEPQKTRRKTERAI